jgi:hypothetical protein
MGALQLLLSAYQFHCPAGLDPDGSFRTDFLTAETPNALIVINP